MKRWMLAMAVLLSVGVSAAHADYLRIIYNLTAAKADPNQQPGAPMATTPGGRPPVEGLPPGPGGLPPAPGGKGGAPGLPQPPPQDRPPPPAAPPPTPGAPRPGVPNVPPILGRLLARQGEEDERLLEAGVVVEYNKFDFMVGRDTGARYDRIYHKWGATGLIPNLPDIRIEFVTEDGNKVPTVAQRYLLQRQAKIKGDKKTVESLLELAEWALSHADIADPDQKMFVEFGKLIGEIREIDPNHKTVKAFEKIQAALDASVSGGDDPAIIWKDRLDHYKVKRSKHYTLIFDAPSGDAAEVNAYLDQLEENMRGFYYWFALKGHALAVPSRRMVAALVNKPDEFQSYRDAFDGAALVADGFYSRRDNLAVFCSMRLDEVYSLLVKNTNPLWLSGWSQSDLLKGKAYAGAKSSQESVKNQMLALLLKAMAEESVRATVSHEGTRQLLVASGLLSQYVEAPEWTQFGVGSFFETPVGAYWPGIGAPHWTYIVKFKVWKKDKKLDTPEVAIRAVITDKYFRDAGEDDKKSSTTKARTMSWSLMYFLMNKKLDGVLKYFQELSVLPRDMVPDDNTLMLCFGRAFELLESSDSSRVDERKLNKLADEWYSFVELTPMESSEALQEAWRNLKAMGDKRKSTDKAKAPKIDLPKLTVPGAKNPGGTPDKP